MKKTLFTLARAMISPSMRFELRKVKSHLKELRSKACLWHWEIVKLTSADDSAHNILYAGRNEKRRQAMALLGVNSSADTVKVGSNLSSQMAFVCEMPIPGALRVPQTLSTIVPLGRSLSEITASYDANLRRLIRNLRANFSTRQVLAATDIDHIDQAMLRPYATARHDSSAVQVERDNVHKFAQPQFGRLDVVYLGNKAVACHLGHSFIRTGKHYWSSLRFGYPEAVFSDRNRLNEVNAMNTYLALEWAIDNGFDYYDLGMSLACPDGGLLHWKRRRKGVLDTLGNHGYFYVRLPRMGAAQFLWNAPLFAVEQGNLTLHLGIPDGKSDEDVLIRYREMGFSGLTTVYLHCQQSKSIVEKFRGIYALQKSPPTIVSITSNPADVS